ncbi:MAG: VWA domain-containing protein, partial [Actinomycetota bacterium]
IGEAINRVNTEADVVWVDGHSDYGHAFEVFFERHGKDINSKTTVLLLGDARNNYHAAQSWVVKEMRKRARHVYWLNPEPKSYWNTGDSDRRRIWRAHRRCLRMSQSAAVREFRLDFGLI